MTLENATEQLLAVALKLHALGWVPATSGNFSARLASGDIAITVSGRDKGELTAADIMKMSLLGAPIGTRQPSAEALLHAQLYQRDAGINAVLHTHSVGATIASQSSGDELRFSNMEILKAFAGIGTHKATIRIPIFPNTQDIPALALDVENHMRANEQGVAYLIEGHGLYTWGEDLGTCYRQIEALEYLFDYDRQQRSLRTEKVAL